MASLRRRGNVVGMKQRTKQWDSVLAGGASVDRELLTPIETVFVPAVQSFCLPSDVNKPPSRVVEVLESANLELRSRTLPPAPTMPDENTQQATAQSPQVVVTSALRQRDPLL